MASTTLLILVLLAVVAIVSCEQSSHVSVRHGGRTSYQHNTRHTYKKSRSSRQRSPYEPPRTYSSKTTTTPLPTTTSTPPEYETTAITTTEAEIYKSPSHPPTTTKPPRYGRQEHHPPPPSYGEPDHSYGGVPECSLNTTKSWCLTDDEYPMYEIQDAARKHPEKVLSLYADVADLGPENSVDSSPDSDLDERFYLCPSIIDYAKPLRAVNIDQKWRVIVNGIKVNYDELSQSVRIEECGLSGEPCPLVPHCYESKCTQKSVYHRFLIYDPYDLYFPFAIETFKLPASCGCQISEYNL